MVFHGRKKILSIFAMWVLGISAQVVTLCSDSYSVLYDPRLKIPVTAEWCLLNTMLGKSQREPSMKFREDSRAPLPRATSADYTNSGFDRGHMVPAADRSISRKAMRETFIMTNVCPQAPALNRGPWKRAEETARSLARKGYQIRIQSHAVFWQADTQWIGRNLVAVPHGFVKTVWDDSADTILFSKYFPNL